MLVQLFCAMILTTVTDIQICEKRLNKCIDTQVWEWSETMPNFEYTEKTELDITRHCIANYAILDNEGYLTKH